MQNQEPVRSGVVLNGNKQKAHDYFGERQVGTSKLFFQNIEEVLEHLPDGHQVIVLKKDRIVANGCPVKLEAYDSSGALRKLLSGARYYHQQAMAVGPTKEFDCPSYFFDGRLKKQGLYLLSDQAEEIKKKINQESLLLQIFGYKLKVSGRPNKTKPVNLCGYESIWQIKPGDSFILESCTNEIPWLFWHEAGRLSGFAL